MENSKSKELLQKVYDHLDSIDVTKLSMRELQDFLEVVQKGQFLESFGQMPACAPFGFNNPRASNSGGGDTNSNGKTGTAAEK